MGDPAGRIDRAALERIIQRAAELQTAERDIAEQLSPEEVLALGRDVGIPDRYLRQAMLEEQTRLPDQAQTGLWDRVAGPGLVGAARVLRGEPGSLERTLLRYMEQHELLALQRQQPGRVSWEPLGGISAAIRRSTAALSAGTRPFMLSKVELVTATLTPLEPGYCHVALQASVRQVRGAYLGGAAAAVTAGAGATAALVVLSAFLPVAVLPLPVGLGAAYTVVRRFRPVAARALLGLERALDNLEGGAVRPAHHPVERTPGLVDLIASEVRRALGSR